MNHGICWRACLLEGALRWCTARRTSPLPQVMSRLVALHSELPAKVLDTLPDHGELQQAQGQQLAPSRADVHGADPSVPDYCE
jgi:hypothetical protein